MQFREYKKLVKNRLMTLPEDKQSLIADLGKTEVGLILMDILGKELFKADSEEQRTSRGGLGAR
jgi:hypothetical protein